MQEGNFLFYKKIYYFMVRLCATKARKKLRKFSKRGLTCAIKSLVIFKERGRSLINAHRSQAHQLDALHRIRIQMRLCKQTAFRKYSMSFRRLFPALLRTGLKGTAEAQRQPQK